MNSLVPILIDIDVVCTSKKHILMTLAARAEQALPVTAASVFDALVRREKLGTTGVGGGVALPNGCVEGITSDKTIFLRLKSAVDFDSIDEEPVDLVYCHLGSPDSLDQDRLRALAKLNKLMSSAQVLSVVRGAESRAAIAAIFEEELQD